jgi:hypothetical protein
VTWGPGRSRIDRLLDADELQRVTPDLNAARRLVDSATRHLVSAATVAGNDPEAAFATSYDAARKACSALLEAQGLRATSRGGHIAVRDAVSAQFGDLPGGGALRPFDRLRRRRNDIEYPSDANPVDSDEVQDALAQARGMASSPTSSSTTSPCTDRTDGAPRSLSYPLGILLVLVEQSVRSRGDKRCRR